VNDSSIRTRSIQSVDPDEVSAFIQDIYSDNQFVPHGRSREDISIVGRSSNGVGLYDFKSVAPFSFVAEEARSNYLFLLCTHGGSTRLSGKEETRCVLDDVIPTSSTGIAKCVSGDQGFGHLSVVLGAETVNGFVNRWVGRELIAPIRFELRPLMPHIGAQWKIAAHCLHEMMCMTPTPDMAIHSLVEHMLAILVTGHTNNHSALLSHERHTLDRLTHSAIALIHSDPVRWKTLGMIAHALDCATGELENGIVRLTGKSSRELFYEARMNGLNRALHTGRDQRFVSALRQYGFSLSDRFVREYRRRFGERPSATYRRNPGAMDLVDPSSPIGEALCERTINQFIDASLDKSISLADLAQLTGLGERAVIAAFKECFSRTPMQYVIERRLERARLLLQNTSASVLSIALECGFGTQSYLATAVKKYFGVTPRQLRLSSRDAADAARCQPAY
jgi:AraC-like DNA-binding protein